MDKKNRAAFEGFGISSKKGNPVQNSLHLRMNSHLKKTKNGREASVSVTGCNCL